MVRGRPERGLAGDAWHPDVELVEKQAYSWVADLGLLSARVKGGRAPRLAARVLPEGPREVVELVARWVTWCFLVEDWVDRGGVTSSVSRLATRMRAVMSGRALRPTDRRLELAFEQLWEDTCLLPMSEQWFARFRRSVRDYGLALVWERRLASSGHVPGWDEFAACRPVANGLFLWDLVEAGTGQEVDVDLPLWAWLRRASCDVVAWRNDLVSVEREAAAGDVDNALVVIERLHGCTRVEARTVLERMVMQRMRDVARSEAGLLAAGARQSSTAWVLARGVPAAHARWLAESGRYVDHSPIH